MGQAPETVTGGDVPKLGYADLPMAKRADFYHGETAREYESRRSDSSIWRREDEILEDVLREVISPDRTTVLDLPVGTGRFIELYKRMGFSLLGMDVSHDMIAQALARKAIGARYVVASAREIPLRSSIADVEVCIRFMHLIDNSLLMGTLRELRRVLKRGGLLVIGARLHSFKDEPGTIARQITLAVQRSARTARFRMGKVNSRSHSAGWFSKRLQSAGFTLIERREVTRYNDGSRYAILLLRATEKGADRSIELSGLPGVGKSTISRALIQSEDSTIADGFRRIQPLSLRECIRARPIGATLFLARLVPVFRQLRSNAAKRVVLVALRQSVVDARTGGTIMYEEGVVHEVWRQLMSGETLSDALIRRVVPIADLTVFLEAPRSHVKERLRQKSSPGPVSRQLLSEPEGGLVWDRAEAHFERIKGIIQSKPGRSVSLDNEGARSDATLALRQVINQV